MAKTNEELTTKIVNNTPAATENKQVPHSEVIKAQLLKMKDQMNLALPKHVSVDRLHRIVLTCFSSNPELFKCTTRSVLKATMESAQLGIFPGHLGEGYLIPYKDNRKGTVECQFQIGYRGMIKLARNSGKVQEVYAVPVYANDPFKIFLGTEQRIEHEMAEGDRGAFIGVYGVAKFVGGGSQFDYMTKKEVDAIWARSKAKDNGPWKTDYIEMAKKTVIKRASKYWPLASEIAEAFEADAARWSENEKGIDVGSILIDAAPEDPEVLDASAEGEEPAKPETVAPETVQ